MLSSRCGPTSARAGAILLLVTPLAKGNQTSHKQNDSANNSKRDSNTRVRRVSWIAPVVIPRNCSLLSVIGQHARIGRWAARNWKDGVPDRCHAYDTKGHAQCAGETDTCDPDPLTPPLSCVLILAPSACSDDVDVFDVARRRRHHFATSFLGGRARARARARVHRAHTVHKSRCAHTRCFW